MKILKKYKLDKLSLDELKEIKRDWGYIMINKPYIDFIDGLKELNKLIKELNKELL